MRKRISARFGCTRARCNLKRFRFRCVQSSLSAKCNPCNVCTNLPAWIFHKATGSFMKENVTRNQRIFMSSIPVSCLRYQPVTSRGSRIPKILARINDSRIFMTTFMYIRMILFSDNAHEENAEPLSDNRWIIAWALFADNAVIRRGNKKRGQTIPPNGRSARAWYIAFIFITGDR